MIAELDLNASAASDDLQSLICGFQSLRIESRELKREIMDWFAEKEHFDAGVLDGRIDHGRIDHGRIDQGRAESLALKQSDWELISTLLRRAIS